MRKIPFLLIVIALSLSCATEQSPPLQVTNLKCEYLQNPLGLDMPHPRLSWQLAGEGRNRMQSAYQIMAASSKKMIEQDSADLWNTGKVDQDQSIHVKYDGKPLKTGMQVFWKVRIWDESGRPSAWSKTATWEMAVTKPESWKAHWISAPWLRDNDVKSLNAPWFRKEFDITKKIKKARLCISGLGYYEFYLNGKKVGDHVLSPNHTNYDRRKKREWLDKRAGNMQTTVLYETYDITASLKEGVNAAGIWLGNGWYILADRLNEPDMWYDTPRAFAQMVIKYEDGTSETIITDGSWKTHKSPILHNGIYSGEIYDARLEIDGWNEPGFDDSTWENAIITRAPAGRLRAQAYPPDRKLKTLTPVRVTLPEKGLYRFDMGRLISGWARLKVSGPAGSTIRIRFVEDLGPTYGQRDTYILNGKGTEVWEPRFTWHAFRFVEVFSPFPLKAENIEGVVVNTDVREAGSFTSSNELYNEILKLYRYTQLGNMHGGVPSDCPHRERRGYTGDGQISCVSAIYSFDMAPFYTKWIRDIRDGQNSETGWVPHTVPYQDGGGGTAWGAAMVIVPWNMYLFYGDKEVLGEHYVGMKKWVQYLESQAADDGILYNQELGEWVPPGKVEIPPELVNTAYYYHCADIMNEVAGILGHENDAIYFDGLKAKAAEAVNSKFFDEADSFYSIGRQGANVFPLGFGITPSSSSRQVLRHLIRHLRDSTEFHFDTGILGTPLMLEVLTEYGRPEIAYTLMNQLDFPGYGYMIRNGATTIWETWPGDLSRSHPMFGSVTSWFYKYLAGIRPDPDKPGFKHSIISPHPVEGLEFVKCSYPTPYGNVAVDWRMENDDFFMSITIPHNTTATVLLPAESIDFITESGKKITDRKDLTVKSFKDQKVEVEIGSGRYRFTSENVKGLLPLPPLTMPVIEPGDTTAFTGDTVFVNIITNYPGAEIRYTLDGTEPHENSPVFHSPLRITGNTMIKARAFHERTEPTASTRAMIYFIDPHKNGLSYKYYERKWTDLPNFSKYEPLRGGRIYQFRLEDINPTADEFGVVYNGSILIEQDGEYTFYLISNDGTRLYIDNKLVTDNSGQHGADDEKMGKIYLTKGTHAVRLDYFQAGGGMFLKVSYQGPDVPKQEIPAGILMPQ